MDQEFEALTRLIAVTASRRLPLLDDRTEYREELDAVTRLVAAKGSRRVILAGLLGMALHGLGPQSAAAQCRAKEGKNKRQCRRKHRENRRPRGGFCGQDKLFGVCSTLNPFIDPCCNGLRCVPSAGLFVTSCQAICGSDAVCKNAFPNKALVCRTDWLVCPVEAAFGIKCCVPR